ATAASIARIIGLPAIDAPGAGPVTLALTGTGARPGGDAPWSLKGAIGGTAIDVTGRWNAEAAEAFLGRISLDSPDISPLAQSLLIAVPQIPPGQPLRIEGGVDVIGYRITIRDMKASVGRAPVTGEIAFNLAEFGRVAGQLRMPEFDARILAPLIFGVGLEQAAGWSGAGFPAPAGVTLPGDLWIEAGRVRLTDDVVVDGSTFILRFDQGLLFLEHATGTSRDLTLTAQAVLRRTGRSVSLSGRTVYRGRLPTLGGAGDGEIEFTALGDSPAQLVGALSGGGALRFRGLAMPALGQATFMDLATQSARSGAPTRTALSDSIRSRTVGRLAVPDGETRVTLAGGVMRFGPVTIHDGMNSVIAAAS
ncbi:MAG: hypothetical protein ACRCTI_11940, partial [Beijerinckiaceae bacterium]